eukprot:3636159-Pyramimonas_sp.AAC.1
MSAETQMFEIISIREGRGPRNEARAPGAKIHSRRAQTSRPAGARPPPPPVGRSTAGKEAGHG